MRTPKRVKQILYYAVYTVSTPIYAKDSEGNIIYDTMPDGATVARVVGETSTGYSEAEEFKNSITSDLTAEELQAFGDEPREKAKMTYKKGEFPFSVGTLIFLEKPEVVNEENADYRVIGVRNTGRHFDMALLVKNV